jgi:hypothetical protein
MSDELKDATEQLRALEERIARLETALRDGFLMVTRYVEKAQGMKK